MVFLSKMVPTLFFVVLYGAATVLSLPLDDLWMGCEVMFEFDLNC